MMADLDVAAMDDALLDETWRQADALHRNRIAHRALHPSNILVHDGKPVVVDFAAAESSAAPRLLAIDRAELLSSLAPEVGSARAIESALRVLAARGRRRRDAVSAAVGPVRIDPKARAEVVVAGAALGHRAKPTGTEPAPVETARAGQGSHAGHDRRPDRRVLRAAAPARARRRQLHGVAHRELRVAARGARHVALTYVASAIGLVGGVPNHLPMIPTIETQMASSFVNRVTPANVGGMALNVRFMQKAGVDPAVAVSGMGLNVVAGAIVHIVLLFVFFAWAGKGTASFKIPTSSKTLVIIAVVLAVVGIVAATRRGRKLVRTHVFGFIKQSATSIALLGRSPGKLLLLFGGSLGVTLAYIGALAASVAGLSRRSELRPGRRGLPRRSAARCRGADTRRTRSARGRARRGVHRRRDGVGCRRRGGAELPAADLLAADPARLDQLPHPRAPQPHLTRVLGSEALAAEPEAPASERAEQEPEARSADHVEGEVHAGVDAGERHQ